MEKIKKTWEGYGEKKKMFKEERKYIQLQDFSYICGSSSSHCLTSLEEIRSSFPTSVSMVIWMTSNHWIISSTTTGALILKNYYRVRKVWSSGGGEGLCTISRSEISQKVQNVLFLLFPWLKADTSWYFFFICKALVVVIKVDILNI